MSLFSGMKLTASKKTAQSISAKVQDESKQRTGDHSSGHAVGHQSHMLQVGKETGVATEEDGSIESKPDTSRLKETTESGATSGTLVMKDVKESDSRVKTTVSPETKSLFSFITETDTNIQGDGNGEKERTGEDNDLDLDPFSVDSPLEKGKVPDTTKLSFDLEGLDLTSISLSPEEETSDMSILATSTPSGVSEMTENKDIHVKLGIDDEATVQTSQVIMSEKEEDSQELLHLEKDQEMSYSPVNFEVNAQTGDRSTDESKDQPRLVAPQYNVELNLEDRLEVLQQMHAAKLRHFSEALEELISQISSTSTNCIHSSNRLLQKQQMLIKIQKQQNEAIAQEDYEQAETLNKECESLESELQKISLHVIPSNHPVILDIIETVTKLQDEEKICRDDQLRDLDEMRKKQETAVEEVKGQFANIEMSEKCSLEEEESALQRDIGHLNLDKEHLDRKEKQMEKRLDEKTVYLREERDHLCSRRKTLQDEIDELEKRLSSIRSQEQELSAEIHHQEELIGKAKEEFADEIQTLDEERSKVNEKDCEVKMRKENIKQIEERITSKIAVTKAEVTREETMLVSISVAIQRSKQDILDLSKNAKNKAITSTIFKPEDNCHQIGSLREKLKMTSVGVQSLTAEVLQAQTKIVSLRQKVSDTEGHIAALNEAKQLAVSGRNFTEAKRLASDIKDLTSEGQKSQEELERMIDNNDKKNKELLQLQSNINTAKEDLLKEEQQYDSNLKDKLLHHIRELQENSEQQASKQSTLSRVIHEADMKSCAMIIQYLCIKHGESVPDDLQQYLVEIQTTEDEEIKIISEPVSSSVDSVENLSEVHSKIEVLEAQLQTAVDEEDYDTAQLLQEQIDELQNSATKR